MNVTLYSSLIAAVPKNYSSVRQNNSPKLGFGSIIIENVDNCIKNLKEPTSKRVRNLLSNTKTALVTKHYLEELNSLLDIHNLDIFINRAKKENKKKVNLSVNFTYTGNGKNVEKHIKLGDDESSKTLIIMLLKKLIKVLPDINPESKINLEPYIKIIQEKH